MAAPENPEVRHFTARWGFVVSVGFLVLTLYFIWAGYGAAPVSLSFLDEAKSESTESMGGMAMGGHGSETGAMTPETFQEITEKFVEDFSLPDGSVRPQRRMMGSMAAMGGGKMGEAARMASSTEIAAAADGQQKEAHGAGEEEKTKKKDPIDVYIMAMQFSYTPRVLRLEKDVSYRFRMMSMDVNHGASIHTGFAGHIMRRPAQTMVEMVMTFPRPGEYMMYCTVYCGEGHSQMKGKIIVE